MKCITFDKAAKDALPENIKEKMRAHMASAQAKMADKTDKRHPAYEWYSSLSLNEMEGFRKRHPFFGKMSKAYCQLHKTYIIELFQYFENEKTNQH